MRQESERAVLLLLALVGTAFTASPPAHAVEGQSHILGPAAAEDHRAHLTHWTAVSTTAMGITGDIGVSEHQMVINGAHSFRIERIRSLTASEVDASKEMSGDLNFEKWDLYKVHIPAGTKFRGGTTMCGRLPTTKVIIAQGVGYGGTELSLIFFSGSKEPFFKGWEESRTGMCGSFGYVRN